MAYYNQGKVMFMDPNYAGLGGGAIIPAPLPFDILADDIRVDMHSSALGAIDPDDKIYTDVDASSFGTNGLNVTNYTNYGEALGGRTVTYDATNDLAYLDAANRTFSNIGNGTNGTMEFVTFQRVAGTPGDATTLLIAHTTTPATLTNGGDIILTWDAAGILQLT